MLHHPVNPHVLYADAQFLVLRPFVYRLDLIII